MAFALGFVVTSTLGLGHGLGHWPWSLAFGAPFVLGFAVVFAVVFAVALSLYGVKIGFAPLQTRLHGLKNKISYARMFPRIDLSGIYAYTKRFGQG